jgi:hypothetical protein
MIFSGKLKMELLSFRDVEIIHNIGMNAINAPQIKIMGIVLFFMRFTFDPRNRHSV